MSSNKFNAWVDKYNKNKNITRKNRIPNAYKVKKEQVDYILKTLRNDKTITMNDYFKRLKKSIQTLILQADILVILLGIILH